MKDNSTKIILVLLGVVIILGCVFGFKVLNEDSNDNAKTHTTNSN